MRYVFFILVIGVMGCSRSVTDRATGDNSIVGKWIQIAYLSDPGDGSGDWQDDNTGANYIILRKDSSAESNGIPYFGELKSYHILSDSTLSFEYADGTVFPRNYKLQGNTLTLSGGCIESCGNSYKRAPSM